MSQTIRSEPELDTRRTARLLGRAIREIAPFRGRFAVKLGLATLSILPALIVPWPLKIQIDHVIEGRSVADALGEYPFFVAPFVRWLADASAAEILLWTALAQLVLVLLMGAFGASMSERDDTDDRLAAGRDTATRSENEANYGHSEASGLLGLLEFRWTIRLTQDLNHRFRSRLLERIQRLPMTVFDDERIGDAIYRVMVDTAAITAALYRLLVRPVVSVLGLVAVSATLGVAYTANRELAWAALAMLPLVFVATWPVGAAIRERSGESRSAGATTASTIEEGMSNILAVQSLGGGDREQRRFDRHSEGSFAAYRRLVRSVMVGILAALLPGLALAGWVLWRVTNGVIDGALSTGDFAVLFAYFAQAATHAGRLGGVWISVQGEAAGLGRVFDLMDFPGEHDPPGARLAPPLAEVLSVERVEFRYADGTPALQGIDLEARSGQLTALVGPAGAGKTTLAYLVPRFLEPSRGRVRIDGVDLAEVTLASLRAQIAFVFQESMLFDGSIAENIRVGSPEASQGEVEEAARTAGAHEFIRSLPEAYETRVGRGGSKLSVGQRQRLAIARALVRRAPILILDEPTSALDPETEARLVKALREASRNRLVLVIAHRLSTVRAADQIVFLDQGVVRERGSHKELMARPDGAYRRFVELQLGCEG